MDQRVSETKTNTPSKLFIISGSDIDTINKFSSSETLTYSSVEEIRNTMKEIFNHVDIAVIDSLYYITTNGNVKFNLTAIGVDIIGALSENRTFDYKGYTFKAFPDNIPFIIKTLEVFELSLSVLDSTHEDDSDRIRCSGTMLSHIDLMYEKINELSKMLCDVSEKQKGTFVYGLDYGYES